MSFCRCLTTLYLIVFLLPTTYAQNTSAFENLLLNATNNINSGSYNQATLELKDALKQAEAIKNKKDEARVYDLLAEICIKKREFKEFKNYDAFATQIASQLKDTALLISLNNRKGIYYMEEGQNELAALQYNTALNLSIAKKETKKSKNNIMVSECL